MPGQHLEVGHTEEARVPNPHRVPELAGQPQKELVKPFAEFICGHAVPFELEQECSRMRLELGLSVGRQYQLLEQLGIQEARVRLTGSRTIPRLLRVGGDRDLLPHLEAHLNFFGDLSEIVP